MASTGVTVATAMLAAACRLGFEPVDDQPVLDLRFADGGTLADAVSGGGVVSFARASTATYVAADGALVVALVDEPRLDHDPSTGARRGLLLEAARTNILRRSDDFHVNAVLRQSAVASDVATAPDGTRTADKLFEPSIEGYAREIDTTYLTTTASFYTQSVFVKAAERHLAIIGAYQSGDEVFVGYDLMTGESFVPPNYVAPLAHGIERHADGWFRIWQTHPSLGGTRRFDVGFVIDRQRSTYIGDGSSGLYLWGEQIEAGDTPSSYIPTGTAPASRAGDLAVIDGIALATVLSPDEGTLLASFSRPPPSAPASAIEPVAFEDAGGAITLAISSGGLAAMESVEVHAAGGTVYSLATAPLAPVDAQVVTAAAYDRAGVLAVTNGGVVTERAARVPDAARLVLGPGARGGFIGHVRRVAYWPTRLSATSMRSLTR